MITYFVEKADGQYRSLEGPIFWVCRQDFDEDGDVGIALFFDEIEARIYCEEIAKRNCAYYSTDIVED